MSPPGCGIRHSLFHVYLQNGAKLMNARLIYNLYILVACKSTMVYAPDRL